jgi:hypothetical protein
VYQLQLLALLVAVVPQGQAGEQLYSEVYLQVTVVLVVQLRVLALQVQTGAQVAVAQTAL